MERIYRHGSPIQAGYVSRETDNSKAMQTLEVTPDEFAKMQDILCMELDEWKQSEQIAALVSVPIEKLVYRKTDVRVVHEVKTRLKLNA